MIWQFGNSKMEFIIFKQIYLVAKKFIQLFS